jgi:hypothetical protein
MKRTAPGFQGSTLSRANLAVLEYSVRVIDGSFNLAETGFLPGIVEVGESAET